MSIEKKEYISDYLKSNAELHPDKVAVAFEATEISWGQLWREVNAKSSFFTKKLGSEEQQVVAILLSNSTEFVVTYLSVLHAGHIAMPLDPAYKKLELDAIIDEIRPALVISDNNYSLQISPKEIPIINVSDVRPVKGSLKLLRKSPKEQVASLTFTSGTTGVPKAAPYTHLSHIWNIEVCSRVWDWTTRDTLLLSLPLSHWYGIVMGLSGAIYHANTIYLLDQRFNARKTLDLLSSGKISFFTHTSLLYTKLLDEKGEFDLSKVRLCVSGGAPLPPDVWTSFKKRFGVEIVETYGSSETGRIAANMLDKKVLGSPGKILPGVDVKTDGDGQILVRTPGLFPGYYQNMKETKKHLSKDGWWQTGDLGYTKKNYVYLKGRIHERIRRFGYTVSPRDVEWAIRKNSEVSEIYVVANQKQNEPNDELIYFIITSLSDRELLDYCQKNLIFAWRPDRIIRMDKMPWTGSGKPDMAKLRKLIGN